MPPKRKRGSQKPVPPAAPLLSSSQASKLLTVLEFLDESKTALDADAHDGKSLREILGGAEVRLQDVKQAFEAVKDSIEPRVLKSPRMILDARIIFPALLEGMVSGKEQVKKEEDTEGPYVLHRQLGDADVFSSSFKVSEDDFSLISEVNDVDLIALPPFRAAPTTSTSASTSNITLSAYLPSPLPYPAPNPTLALKPPTVPTTIYFDPFSSFAPSYDSSTGVSTFDGAIRAWNGRERLEDALNRSSSSTPKRTPSTVLSKVKTGNATAEKVDWEGVEEVDRDLERLYEVETALGRVEELLGALQEGQNVRMRKALKTSLAHRSAPSPTSKSVATNSVGADENGRSLEVDEPSISETEMAAELVDALVALISLVPPEEMVDVGAVERMMGSVPTAHGGRFGGKEWSGTLDWNNGGRVVL
ncbi:hypothetical protein BT69DRAFT_1286908 [Atractiella rhizophila]|nr:hypothetical protein BT69DRAFT_1286908 [Atractiella rhizophila]